MNKYDRLNKPLSKAFSQLAVKFAQQANDQEEEKLLLLMAREVWNISYFDRDAQYREIERFITSLDVEQQKEQYYTTLMIQGIQEKKKITKQIDLPGVWTRVEHFKAWKANEQYRIEFEFDFYE